MPAGRKTGGRKKGVPNRATKEIREELTRLFTPEYFADLPRRLAEGKLAPQIEAKLLAYRFGEPKQQMELSGSVTVPNIVFKEYVARD
jgi:hypothetical protein